MRKAVSTIVLSAALILTAFTAEAGAGGFDHVSGSYLENEGARIYYEEIPNPGRPVLVFLHGGFGDIGDFDPIVGMFTTDYHIIGMDSRGHGKSTLGPNSLTYKRLQEDVEAVINHLQPGEIDIIGYSDGGIVAYRMAAAKNVPIRSIVTIGAAWSISDAELMERLMAGMTPEKYRADFRHSYQFHEKYNPEPDFDRFARCVSQMWFDKTEDGYPLESVRRIDIPVLIVRGDEDAMFPHYSAVELASRIENSVLVNIPSAPHAAFRKYPGIFETITKEFLTGHK